MEKDTDSNTDSNTNKKANDVVNISSVVSLMSYRRILFTFRLTILVDLIRFAVRFKEIVTSLDYIEILLQCTAAVATQYVAKLFLGH